MSPIRLRDLGPISVSSGEPGAGTVVTQPRLLALLAYLVVARPRGPHSRDTLIALLWPEADQASGRQALRNALHRLRSALGDRTIISVGENFVTIAAGAFTSDSLEFEDAVSERRWHDAIRLCNGPFLNGFHVDGAPDFAHWVDGERARLTTSAVSAAWSAVDEHLAASELAKAVGGAAFACSLAPDDERSFRRHLGLLMDVGDPVAARRAYATFADRLKAEYDIEPSPETRAVLDRVRPASAARMTARQAVAGIDSAPERLSAKHSTHPTPKRRLTAVAASVTVVLAAVTFAWTPTDSLPVAGAELAPRWRADTALFARYLRGRSELVNRRLKDARETFYELSHDAPTYGPGWAGLALATLRSGFDYRPPRDAVSGAVAAVERAMELDSSSSMAHEALIGIELWGRWNLKRAKERLDVALAIHPNDAPLLNLLATWHRWRGEFDASLAIKQANAAAADPLATAFAFQILPSLFFAHRCEEAVDAYRRLPQEIRDSVVTGPVLPAMMCAGLRDDAATVIRDQAIREKDSTVLAFFTEPQSPAGRDSAIEATLRVRLDRLHMKNRTGWVPRERFMMNYALRKHADSTMVWLEEMLLERSMMLYVVPFDPLMDFLRSDPRFDDFLSRLPWIRDLAEPQRLLIDSLRKAR